MATKGFVARTMEAGLAGLAEALFPANEIGAPDWRDAEIVPRTLAYMAELPRPQRRLMVFLFVLVELAAPFLVPCLSRFSRLAVERRTTAVRGWRKSRFVLFRYLGEGIKATMTMQYMSHPRVLAHVGVYKTCTNPHDPLQLDVRVDALRKAPHAEARA
ncbi:MAG: hypothetical protein KC619_07615 [Myxococcales bacterium]|nr:hypothetical protein [Myxococcales bacterium]